MIVSRPGRCWLRVRPGWGAVNVGRAARVTTSQSGDWLTRASNAEASRTITRRVAAVLRRGIEATFADDLIAEVGTVDRGGFPAAAGYQLVAEADLARRFPE